MPATTSRIRFKATLMKQEALAANPAAKATWADITPIARRDWILWITTSKQTATRARRILNACDMLASGKRRVCCFDRSGFFSKSLGVPRAAVQKSDGA
jgi:Bacteriocin-protection, YdeI or OmpD-Associated